MTQPFVERRSGTSGFAALMEMMKETNANVSQLRVDLHDGISAQKLALEDVLADAFPEADPVGHRKAHEAAIKAAEEKAKFWADVRASTAKWGIAGVLGWAALSLWNSFLQGPHK